MNHSMMAMAAGATVAAASATAQMPSGLPGPGEPLPDVTIYDDQGEEFQLRRLKGEHTVLVFGCLT